MARLTSKSPENAVISTPFEPSRLVLNHHDCGQNVGKSLAPPLSSCFSKLRHTGLGEEAQEGLDRHGWLFVSTGSVLQGLQRRLRIEIELIEEEVIRVNRGDLVRLER